MPRAAGADTRTRAGDAQRLRAPDAAGQGQVDIDDGILHLLRRTLLAQRRPGHQAGDHQQEKRPAAAPAGHGDPERSPRGSSGTAGAGGSGESEPRGLRCSRGDPGAPSGGPRSQRGVGKPAAEPGRARERHSGGPRLSRHVREEGPWEAGLGCLIPSSCLPACLPPPPGLPAYLPTCPPLPAFLLLGFLLTCLPALLFQASCSPTYLPSSCLPSLLLSSFLFPARNSPVPFLPFFLPALLLPWLPLPALFLLCLPFSCSPPSACSAGLRGYSHSSSLWPAPRALPEHQTQRQNHLVKKLLVRLIRFYPQLDFSSI